MTFIQYILLAFSGCLFVFSAFLIHKNNKGQRAYATLCLVFSVALVIVASLKLIKEITIEGFLTVKTHVPTLAELAKSDKVEQSREEVSISEEPIFLAAQERPEEKRSAVDFLLLATNSWKTKEPTIGISFANQGLAANSTNIRVKASLQNRLGALYEDIGAETQAFQYYKKAICTDPGFFLPYNNLGNVLKNRGKLVEAEQAYRDAIELEPKHSFAHNNLGTLLFLDPERLVEAEQAYRTAIAHYPKYVDPLYNLGNLLLDQKRFSEAEQAYRKATELDSKDAALYLNLGTVLAVQRKLADAEQAYRKVIELDIKDASAHNNLGNVLVEQDKLADAEMAYRRAIELDSEFVNAYRNLVDLLKIQGRLAEAQILDEELNSFQ